VSKLAVIVMAYVFTIVMGAFVFLSLRHIDTASLVTFAIGLIAGVVPSVGSYVKAHETRAAVQSVSQDITTVKEQTNGPLTAAIKTIEQLSIKMNNIENLVNELKGGSS
jgi:uncharacterized protein YoxC